MAIYERHHWGDNGIPMPIGSVSVPGPLKGTANSIGLATASAMNNIKKGAWQLTKTAVGGTVKTGVGLAGWTIAGTADMGIILGKTAASMTGAGLAAGAKHVGKALTSKPAQKFYKSVARDIGNITKSMVSYTPEHIVHDEIKGTYEKVGGRMKFSKKGLVAIAAASFIGGAMKAGQDVKASRMGTIDSRPTTATPDYMPKQYERHPSRSYLDNAGATGDLVFALNALRH